LRLVKVSARAERTWQSALDQFLLVKKANGAAPRTRQDYRDWCGRFFDRHPGCWSDYEALRSAAVEYFGDLADKAPATFNLARKNLKAFFGWCVAEGILPANPLDGIKKRKDGGKPRSVDLETVKRLLDLCDRRTFAGLRDYTAILFSLDTGIRPSEMLALKPCDLNLRALEAHIPPSVAKTREGRTVVFSPPMAKALVKLLQARPAEWPEKAPVFASQDGTEMKEPSWAHRLAAYSKRLGVKITPYTLRHTCAISSLRRGMDVFAVQRQLGHADLQMTKRYVHLAGEDIHKQHETASPVTALFPGGRRVRKI